MADHDPGNSWLAPTLIAIGGVFVTAWGAVLSHLFGRLDKQENRINAIEAALRADQGKIWDELKRHTEATAMKDEKAAEKREEIIMRLGNTATREDLNQMRQSIERILQQRTLSL